MAVRRRVWVLSVELVRKAFAQGVERRQRQERGSLGCTGWCRRALQLVSPAELVEELAGEAREGSLRDAAKVAAKAAIAGAGYACDRAGAGTL